MAMDRFRAPNLPAPTMQYDRTREQELLRALEIYFSQLDSTTPVTFDSITLTVDDPYGVSWDGDLTVPTKNAVYDQLQIAGGTATWGSITGTLSDQTDLQTALDAKADDTDLANYLLNTTDTFTGTLTVQDATNASVRIRDTASVNQRLDLVQNAGIAYITAGNNTAYGDLRIQQFDGTSTIDRIQMLPGGTINFLDQTGTNRFIVNSTGATVNDDLYVSGSNPIMWLVDTDTGADSYVSGTSLSGSLFIRADVNNEVAGSAMFFGVDGTDYLTISNTGSMTATNGAFFVGDLTGTASNNLLNTTDTFTGTLSVAGNLTATGGVELIGGGTNKVQVGTTSSTGEPQVRLANTQWTTGIDFVSSNTSKIYGFFNRDRPGWDVQISGTTGDVTIPGTLSADGNLVLNRATNFAGDVSGVWNALVVADDSHNHSNYLLNTTDTFTGTLTVDGLQTINSTGTGLLLNTDLGNEGGIVMKKDGVVSPTNVEYRFSTRPDNTDFLLYSNDGTTFHNLLQFDYSASRIYVGDQTDMAIVTLAAGSGLLNWDGTDLSSGGVNFATDTDLANYLLNTTDTLTGTLTVQGSTTLRLGADEGATTLTDANQKVARVGAPHYLNSEESVALVVASNQSAANIVLFGGGTASFNAATKLSFFTAANNTTTTGTERMAIDSAGNVGIGVTNPSLLFQVGTRGGMGSDGVFQWGSALTGNNRGVLTWDTDKAIVGAPLNLAFATNSITTERMRIDSAGNVGIGTTAPDARLDLGTASAISTTNAIFARQPGGDGNFHLVAATGTGIGTNTEFFKLGIEYDNGVTRQENAYINFYRGGGTAGGFLSFSTSNNTERWVMEADGDFRAVGDHSIIWPTNASTVGASIVSDSVNSALETRIDRGVVTVLRQDSTALTFTSGGNENLDVTNNSVTLRYQGTSQLVTDANGVTAQNELTVVGDGATIASATWANGWFKVGTSSSGWSMDGNELYNSGAAFFGTLAGALGIQTNSADAINFSTNASTRMTLGGSGTLTLSTPLDVNSTAAVSGGITLDGAAANTLAVGTTSATGESQLRLRNNQWTTGVDVLTNATSGKTYGFYNRDNNAWALRFLSNSTDNAEFRSNVQVGNALFVLGSGSSFAGTVAIGSGTGRLQIGSVTGRSWMAPRNSGDTAYDFNKEFGFDTTLDAWYYEAGVQLRNANTGLSHYRNANQSHVISPGGGMYQNNNSVVTGHIKITMPVTGTADMISFWVDVFDYTSNESFSVYIAGYVYQTIGLNVWVNETAIILGSIANRDLPVYFGHDGTNACVWIGDTTDTWSYPQVMVRNVHAAYTANLADWEDGWSIDINITARTSTERTITSALPYVGLDGYLPLSGGTMTGLLDLNAGLTVDGVRTSVWANGDTNNGFRLRRNAASTDGDDIVDLKVFDNGLYIDIDNDNDGDSSDFIVRYRAGGAWNQTLVVNSSGITYIGQSIFHDGYHPNADTWTTARTLTIGNTGKSVNGSANVSWSHSEMGVLKNTTDTLTGNLTVTGIALSDYIQSRSGNGLTINIGESAGIETTNPLVAEQLFINGEGGVQINCSPDNWASGWAGRVTHTINNTGIISGADITTSGIYQHTGTPSRDKVRVWSNSAYTIGMDTTFTFGGLSDYAMTFQMNNQNTRGFWWGDNGHTDAQGAMSLTTDGKLAIAHSIRVGYGESDTTTPGATHRLDVSGSINSTSTINDSIGDVRKLVKSGTTSGALGTAAAGYLIRATGGVTITDDVHAANTTIMILNKSGGNITITQDTNLTMTWTDGTTGNRTLANNGVCTVWFNSTNDAHIWGTGLS